MSQRLSKPLFYVCSFLACGVVALTTGCASGGFKLTRQYAGFVNRQDVVIRVVLYILTFVVFAVTVLIDMVIFNTMDFWNGTVAQGTYEFNSAGKVYQAHHEVLPNSLKRSTIRVFGKDHALIQTVVLQETMTGEIEMFVDGRLRTRVRDLASIPVASIFDAKGALVRDEFIPQTQAVAIAKSAKLIR